MRTFSPRRMTTMAAPLLAVALLTTPLVHPALPAGAATTATLTPVADAWVNAGRPDTNFGRGTGLAAGTAYRSYLRFNATVASGNEVRRATLRLYAAGSSTEGFRVSRTASSSWGETSITWNNAPGPGGQVGASGPHSGGAYVNIDVTPLVRGTGPVSLMVTRAAMTPTVFNSREATQNRPQLVVVTGAPLGGTIVYATGDADGSLRSVDLAKFVRARPVNRFFYLGDVYESGTANEFATRYEPAYGPLASKTDPVIGNHDYDNRSTGYLPYWAKKRGWSAEQAMHRSYVDASGWQIIAYSSQSDMSAEARWVADQVAKRGGTCRIVMAHRGRHVVTDTSHADNADQGGVWSAIAGKTAINLVGHNHIYGRLVPMSGVTVIVTGAGGHGLRALGSQHHVVARAKAGVPTVTRLVLRPGVATFEQLDAAGRVYDSGTIACTPA